MATPKSGILVYLPTRLEPGSSIQIDRHEYMVMTTCQMNDGTTEHRCAYLVPARAGVEVL